MKSTKTRGAWAEGLMGVVLTGSLISSGAYGKHLDVSAALTGTSPDCHGKFRGKQVPRETLKDMVAAHARWLADHQDPKGVQADLCGADLAGVDFREED